MKELGKERIIGITAAKIQTLQESIRRTEKENAK